MVGSQFSSSVFGLGRGGKGSGDEMTLNVMVWNG